MKCKLSNTLSYPHEWWKFTKYASDEAYVHIVEHALKARADTILELADRFDWNLFFVVFSEPDWLMHRLIDIHFGRELQLVIDVFRIIDNVIKHLSEVSDLTIICSDHGFRVYKGVFYVNEFLNRLGLLKYKVAHLGSFSKSPTFKADSLFSKFSSSVILNVYNLINNLLLEHLPTHILNTLIYRMARLLGFRRVIDYDSSIALSSEIGVVYVRKASSYVKRLLEDTDYMRVISIKDIYSVRGSYIPDLIIMPKHGIWPHSGLSISGSLFELKRFPEHDIYGIFIAYGDNIVPGSTNSINCVDIVPTVLAYMGLPIPKGVDGNPINNVIYNKESIVYENLYTRWFVNRRVNDTRCFISRRLYRAI